MTAPTAGPATGRVPLSKALLQRVHKIFPRAASITIGLACIVGIAGGFGAVVFTWLIHTVQAWSYEPFLEWGKENRWWLLGLLATPPAGLLLVSWLTRRFAPEAQGHGVPEVVLAVARRDGVIRPRVSVIKILASALCIGTGGSIGREGPIVQIGAALGSVGGQAFKLSPRHIKTLVAAGAAAGISATFNAPLAGVMFASEIILGSFAVESLTPIVIASVLAKVVQTHIGEHRSEPAFRQLAFNFGGAWEQIPSFVLLGLTCGLFAVAFTRMVYWMEDFTRHWIPDWKSRALVLGGLVGLAGLLYPMHPPAESPDRQRLTESGEHVLPPLFGVGYGVVDHALHLDIVRETGETAAGSDSTNPETKTADGQTTSAADKGDIAAGAGASAEQTNTEQESPVQSSVSGVQNFVDSTPTDYQKRVTLTPEYLWREFWWLLPLAFLKPVLTSVTLAGGGSGGIFAPSLFIGATVGAAFGVVCNIVAPDISAEPGVYAIVGMGAVVAGTTHGIMSAVLIVYEMTSDYYVIVPIMAAAGLASLVARFIEPDSIYELKITRRGISLARGHEMHRLEHVMVRDVMLRRFPSVKHSDNLPEIIRVAKANPQVESLAVMDDAEKLVGIIRPEDLHRLLDTEVSGALVNAADIAHDVPVALSPDENLLEAIRDFGTRDIETLPVVTGTGDARTLVGILQRADVMRRYREELLRKR